VRYYLNLVDAENPEFLERLRPYKGQKNRHDLNPSSELVLPNLTHREFQLG
jgi:hypothetical protein